jgi:hypothetical protein
VLSRLRPAHQLEAVQLQAAPQDPHRGETLRLPGLLQGLQAESAHGEHIKKKIFVYSKIETNMKKVLNHKSKKPLLRMQLEPHNFWWGAGAVTRCDSENVVQHRQIFFNAINCNNFLLSPLAQ